MQRTGNPPNSQKLDKEVVLIMYAYILLISVLALIGIICGVLQHKGYPVLEYIKFGFYWVVAVVPILFLIMLYVISFLQIIGIDMLTLIGVSNQYQDYLIIYFWAFTPFSMPSVAIGYLLIRTDGTKLRAVDARTGKTGGWELPDEKWEDLTVEDYRGNQIGKDGLHDVPWYGGGGWEADEYDPDTNTAITSYYTKYTPEEIRTNKQAVKDIRTTFLDGYDASLETQATRERRATEDAARTGNDLVKGHEYAMLPSGELPDSPIQSHLEDTADDEEHESEDAVEVHEQSSSESDSGDSSSADTGDVSTGGGESE